MYGPPRYAPCYCHACTCERAHCDECGTFPDTEPPADAGPAGPDPWDAPSDPDIWEKK